MFRHIKAWFKCLSLRLLHSDSFQTTPPGQKSQYRECNKKCLSSTGASQCCRSKRRQQEPRKQQMDVDGQHENDDDLSKSSSLFVLSLPLWGGLYREIKPENSNNYVQPMVKLKNSFTMKLDWPLNSQLQQQSFKREPEVIVPRDNCKISNCGDQIRDRNKNHQIIITWTVMLMSHISKKYNFWLQMFQTILWP